MKKNNPPAGAALRRKALKKLKDRTGLLRELSSKDMEHLITELGTHQIELEMQNEELRKAQVELEASRRKYADLYDFSPVGYFTFDRRGVIMDANLTGAGQLGVSKRDLIKKPFSFFLADEEGRKTFADHCAGVLRTGAGAACELKLKRKDGALFHARLQSIISGKDGGEPVFVRSAVSDVTSLTEMENQLRESEESFKRIAETSSDVIFQLDAQGRVIYVSPAVNRYGYKPEAIIGTSFVSYVDPRDIAKATDAFGRAASGTRIDMLELRLLYATGDPYNVEVNVTPVKKHGAVVAIQGISRDITARQRSEEALRTAHAELESRTYELDAVNRELEDFAFTVANDLKAPLRSIEGFTRAALEDYGDKLDDAGRDYLLRVTSASLRMTQLIDAMLSMARLTRGELHEKTVDLSSLAQVIAHNLQNQDLRRKVKFVIAEKVKVNGDQDMLQVALENLLDNSWKFTSKHDTAAIEFGTVDMEGKKVFFVRDDGAGFDMKFADKLFKPFQRLHAESEFPGLGIGLAIAHRIVIRHGGRIWAEGAVEKGATVYFTL